MSGNTKIVRISYKALTLLTVIIGLGLYLRVVDVWRPIGGEVALRSTLWREADVASIARNFYQEDNNVLYPRVDWRENTPGFAESEFPLYPWILAQEYYLFGYHEQLARILSLIISLVTLYVLSKTAFMILSEFGALVASAFFAVNPLMIYLSTAVQSDTLMLLFLSSALYFYLRSVFGSRTESTFEARDYLISAGFLSLAILCKMTAASFGMFLAIDALRRNRWKSVFSDKTTYIALAIVLIPNVAWSVHSYQFWIMNHLSLGVTNESHFIGSDILLNWSYYRGFLNNTVSYVTSYPGGIVLIVGLWAIRNSKYAGTLYSLGISLAVFYFVTLYTTGASWAFYYHALSIPFVGLVFGMFANEISSAKDHIRIKKTLPLIIVATSIAGYGIGLALGFPAIWSITLGAVTVALAFILIASRRVLDKAIPKQSSITSDFVITVMSIVLIALSARSFRLVPQEVNFVSWNQCALRYAHEIPENARIACWGSRSGFGLDRSVAYNAPWMFFWMNRKGFSIPEDLQSIATLDSVAQLGAEYYVEFLPGAYRTPGFHNALQSRYTMIDSCGAHVLYSLK